MDRFEKILEQFAILILAISGLMGILVTSLDLLGTDFQSGPWTWVKGPSDITLLIVSVLALGLGLERYVRLRNNDSSKQLSGLLSNLAKAQGETAKLIIDSLKGVEVRSFDDEIASMEYMNSKISQAKVQIDDAGSLSTGDSKTDRYTKLIKAYQSYMDEVNRASKNILYRDIFVFDRQSRKERFLARIRQNTVGYSCAYLKETNTPLINFMIFDKEEVLIISNKYQTWFSVRHPSVTRLFTQYFEELWKSATVLKSGNEHLWRENKEIKEMFGDDILEQVSDI